MADSGDARAAFIEATAWHGSLDRAAAILAAHPEIATSDIYTAAILGDDATVRRFLAEDPTLAAAKGGPLGWDALTYLCFSRYLRLEPLRSDGFVRAATALLDAGANANTGFVEEAHQPKPVLESVLYGAAGVAHHAALTRLLLERGADPNDDEVPYHAPETDDNAALRVLVESGKLTADSLATMLLRKADWHDEEGIDYLLRHGADPNRMTHWGLTALHQSVRRDNGAALVARLLDAGADPALPTSNTHRSAIAIAARRGRGDLLELFARRGTAIALTGVERLIAACAANDGDAVRSLAGREPDLVRELVEQGGTLLAQFAGNGNTDGVRALLDLGVGVTAPYEGDGYFGIAPQSTALHVAAWRARHETVALLLARAAPADARDAEGQTPLMLAVRACVDSYWTRLRTPQSVLALLEAGASVDGVLFPSGYSPVDALLKSRGARAG